MAGRRRPHHLLLLLLGHDLLVLLLEHQLLLVVHVLLQLLVRVMGSLHGLGRRMRGAGRPNGPGGGTTSLLLLLGACPPRECSSLMGRHAEQGVAVRLHRLHRLLEDIPVRVIATAATCRRRAPGIIHGVEQRLRKEEFRLLLSGGDGGAGPDLPGRCGCSGRTLPGVLGRTGGDEGGGARGGEPAARTVRHDRLLLLLRKPLLLVPER